MEERENKGSRVVPNCRPAAAASGVEGLSCKIPRNIPAPEGLSEGGLAL